MRGFGMLGFLSIVSSGLAGFWASWLGFEGGVAQCGLVAK